MKAMLCSLLAVASTAVTSCHAGRSIRLEVEQQPRLLMPGQQVSSSPRLGLWVPNTVLALAVAGEGSGSRLEFSVSETGGDSFGTATPLSDSKAHVRGDGENSPVFYTNIQGDIFAGWFQTDATGHTQYMVARSTTFGQSFDKPVAVLDGQRKEDAYAGFPTITASHKGEVFVAWLDERDSPEPKATSSVYFARSTDRGLTFSRNIRVAGAACPCCRPQLAMGQNGEVYLAWRKVFDGDIRDMVMARSLDGGKTFSEPVRVGVDNWILHACPDTGPAVVSFKGHVYVAWFSEGHGKPGIRLAVSSDQGQTFHDAGLASGEMLDANHPRLSVSEDGRVLLAFQARPRSASTPWRANQLYVAQVGEDGAATSPVQITHGDSSATHPDLIAGTSGRVFIAWDETGERGTRAIFSRAWIR